MSEQWGVNAVQCWLGSLAEILVQITVADVYHVHERGLMNSIYIFLSNAGSTLGPVIAGFETTGLGWRWVWWLLVIVFGVQFFLMFFGFEESKFHPQEIIEGRSVSVVGEEAGEAEEDEPVILAERKKSVVSIKQDAPSQNPHTDPEKLSASQSPSPSDAHRRASITTRIDPTIPRKTYRERLALFSPSPGRPLDFLRHTYQPFLILFTIPGVAYSSLVYAVLLAWSTTQSAALSTYMIKPPYNFSATGIGLMNLAPFIGNTLGSAICGVLSDWLVLRLAKRNGGVYEPGMRTSLHASLEIFADNKGCCWQKCASSSFFLSFPFRSQVPFGSDMPWKRANPGSLWPWHGEWQTLGVRPYLPLRLRI